jgi:hypothetical protein
MLYAGFVSVFVISISYVINAPTAGGSPPTVFFMDNRVELCGGVEVVVGVNVGVPQHRGHVTVCVGGMEYVELGVAVYVYVVVLTGIYVSVSVIVGSRVSVSVGVAL